MGNVGSQPSTGRRPLRIQVPLALVGPALFAYLAAVVADDASQEALPRAELVWWAGAWVSAAFAGLGVYLIVLGSRHRAVGVALLLGSGAGAWIAWGLSHFPYS